MQVLRGVAVVTTLLGLLMTNLPVGAETPSFRQLPGRLTAVYSLNPPRVSIRVTITHNQSQLQYHTRARLKGLLAKFVSSRVMTEGKAHYEQRRDGTSTLRPAYYRYDDDNDPDQLREYRFNWPEGRVAVTYRGKDYSINLVPRIIDENLVYLNLAMDAQRLGAKLNKTYSMIARGKLKQRTFVATGYEDIETKLGKIETLRVERHKRGKHDRTLWLSPSHAFLPLKVAFLRKAAPQTLSIERFEVAHSER